jgi:DNA-binding PucR family transcriptional regulator
VALASLITSDAGQAGRFVREELGPVADDSDQMRRLRATLTTFLDEGMRPVRAARRLGIHQNTVLYRIRQAEELLGRPLTERRLELEAALRLAATGDWTPPAAG